MKNILQIPLSDDFKEAVTKAARDVVKSITRSEYAKVVSEEVVRLLANEDSLKEALRRGVVEATNVFLHGVGGMLVETGIEKVVKSDLYSAITHYAKKAVDEAVEVAVAKKLANKTVWEAESQVDFIRKIARQEAVNTHMALAARKS